MEEENERLFTKITYSFGVSPGYHDIYNFVIADRKHRREELLKHLPSALELGDMLDENTDEGHTSLSGTSDTLKDFVEGVLDNVDSEEKEENGR